MKHTDNDVQTAIEYAALLLEQLDAGGSLPEMLRQHAKDIQLQCQMIVELRAEKERLHEALAECQYNSDKLLQRIRELRARQHG